MNISPALQRVDANLIGPDATTPDRLLGYGAATTGTLVAVAAGAHAGYSSWVLLVLGLVGFDLFGGATTNAMDAAKRWWYRPGQTSRHHFVFVALHIQPFVVAWTVPGFGWWTALATYLTVLVGAVVVLVAPPSLRRPAGFTVTTVASTVILTVADVPAAIVWFVPVLLIKLLLAHLQPESASR
ncbi:hypothetical protein [Nocardia sp. CNY236]|uniref:hypothetical protein n=1 Tax=Nocardia sp. CNY236 TaxID=1169152 RepID=UPI0003F5688A|nr:hypothetical protein [Nocardia sp. CNY236]